MQKIKLAVAAAFLSIIHILTNNQYVFILVRLVTFLARSHDLYLARLGSRQDYVSPHWLTSHIHTGAAH